MAALVPLITVLLLTHGVVRAQQEPGHIEVTCEPGVEVYLDGQFQGVTKADVNGLLLKNIPAGSHIIKVVKEGFTTQQKPVEVATGKVLRHTVQPFSPKMEITETGTKGGDQPVMKVGVLIVQSLPITCRIEIPGLEEGSWDKKEDEWKARKARVGNYRGTFRALGKAVEGAFTIDEGVTTRIFVNIMEGTFEVKKRGSLSSVDLDGVTMEFILIRPGTFTMGSDKDAHKVTLTKPFYLGKYEVTQEQWEKVMGSNPSRFKGAKNPVEQVSWTDCQSFVAKLQEKVPGQTFRLPTEAEWEYACRAGTTGDYCYGDGEGSLAEYAWYKSNAKNTTHPVGEKKPNAWGLYDMHGNVWEWCADWYGDYSATAVDDPQGSSSGSHRMIRGGSWVNSAYGCLVANRCADYPARSGIIIGFRVTRSTALPRNSR